jgi:Tfp pilus assembly protein PilF
MIEETTSGRPGLETRDRVIRVFISSTFRDMMRERDLLVKEVFPQLRRKCAQRFVTFTEVDLRWGITEAQANEGQVLPLCLAEIERSRPYFIGLLGERYGWIPDTIGSEVIEREPWLEEHLRGRTSVTELEILHGVLNDPAMRNLAFFYFRAPAYAADPGLAPDERWDMIEHDLKDDIERYGEVEANRRTEERKIKLAALKQRIRDSKLPLVEPYANPRELAEIVLNQFDGLIDRLYPEDRSPDPLEQERMAHQAFAKRKLFACIDRPSHLEALNAFAAPPEHRGKGLVVTGESGGGKTALLAAWARDWVKTHPGDFLFQHYFGSTSDSASPERFLRRLLGELKVRFGISEDLPARPDKLREALPVWLAQTLGKGRILLVLDGLDQVQGDEPDRRLHFLPSHFPPNTTVLASALPGPALDALRESGWVEHDLSRASGAEVDSMIDRYLEIHARTLEPVLRRELAMAPGAKNPLFLRTVLEELRQFGSFERLPERVRHYLEAGNPKDLFLRVLRRWQEDFDGKDAEKDKPRLNLVSRAMSYLWAARQGLSEPEWLDLLGPQSPGPSFDLRPLTSDALPRAFWTPLFLALEPHMSRRAGLLAFGHDFLRQAVEAAFLPSDSSQKAAHLAIADYFERHEHQCEMTPRKAVEWPYQLHAAEAWDRLETCLTDIPLFLALSSSKTRWELTGYWHPLRRLGRDMGGSYGRAYEQWIAVPANASNPYVPAQLGQFLSVNGLYLAAEPLLRRALEVCERVLGPEHPDTLGSVSNLAQLLQNKGDCADAQPLHERALEAYERVFGPEDPNTLSSVSSLAALLQGKGDYTGALSLYERALKAYMEGLGPEHPDTLTSINNLAKLLQGKGDYAAARTFYEWALKTRERALGPEHPDTLVSLNNLAGLLESDGDYAGAQPLYERALKALERVLGPEHPSTLASLSNLAGMLERNGNYAAAQPLYERALEAGERVLGPEHPDTLKFLNNLAFLLMSKGDYAGAQPLYERALEALQRVLGPEHPDTLTYSNNLAGLLDCKGDYAAAQPLYERTLEARERVLGREHPDTLSSLNNLAGLLRGKHDYAGARLLYERALEASERVLGPEHPHTLVGLRNLAGLLESQGDYAGAQPIYERAFEALLNISASIGRAHPDLQSSIYSYAQCLEKLGRSREEVRNLLNDAMRPFGMGLGGEAK